MSVPTKVLRQAATAVYIYDKADNAIKWFNIGRDAIDPATRNEAYLKMGEEIAKMAGIGIPVYYIEKVLQKSGLDLVFDSMKNNQTLQEYLARQGFKTELFKFGLAKTLEAFVDKFSEYSGQRGWLDPVFDAVNGKFTSAENFVFRIDPLALDLDGDGIETVGTTAGVKFDFDGDGVKTGTGWISSDDGFLVLDRNLNGTIDTGSELFGVDTVKSSGSKAVNGFDALSDLDSNADGVFDASDEKFSSVKVWQDKNRDGISQADELKSLSDLKIKSIGLSSTSSGSVQQDNVIAAVGVFTYEDGHTGFSNGNQSLAASLDLASNPFYSQFPAGEISDEAALLPNMAGAGAVRDLVEAATLSPELLSELKTYSQATSREQQLSLIDGLLESWSATSDSKMLQERIEGLSGEGVFKFVWSWEVLGAEPTAAQIERAALIEKIAILEIFNGRGFFDFNLTSDAAGGVALKIRSGSFERVKSIGIIGEGQQIIITENDLSLNAGQEQLLRESYSELTKSVYQGLLEQTRLKPYLDSVSLSDDLTRWDFTELTVKLQQSYSMSAVSTMEDMLELFSSSAGEVVAEPALELFGNFYNMLSETNRELLLAQMPGLIVGGDFNDLLKATLHKSYVFGGKGSDSIFGADGKDLLVGGDGADSISAGDGDDLLLGEEGDDILSGQAGDDYLTGGEGNDQLHGDSGNDTLEGGAGDDTLDGGMGSNQLFGDDGNDLLKVDYSAKNNVLAGGAGDDQMYGSFYNDTYLFNLGDGKDVVTDYDAGYVATDTLRFGAGILASDIQVLKSGSDVVFKHRNGIDQVTVKGWLDGTSISAGVVTYSIIERVEFADGTFWTSADIAAKGLSQVGTAAAETLIGWSGNDIIHGGDGNDTLSGGAGANQLYGDAGDDIITVAAASKGNTLVGGIGNDTLTGGNFADTYVFNLGDGKDVVTDYDAGYVATDTLRFGAGILANDITTRRVNSDLVFLHSNGTDQITFKGWFDGATSSAGVVTYNVIERVEFADGTFWTWADIVATGLNQVGTAAAETLIGWSGNDIIHGGDGSDTLSGGAGANQLYGDAGDDTITVATASKGNTLVGGTGNDTLTGGYYTDTYVFNLGDGKDVIADYDAGYVVTDTLRFGAGILASDIQVLKSGSDVVFKHRDGTDQVTVKGWLDGTAISAGVVTNNIIERVEFADGTFWTSADIAATGLSQIGTAAAETLTGWSGNDIIHGGDGNDTLSGGAGANQLYGDAGDDIITVAAASKGNTLVGGIGNDTLTGGNFADTYVFNLGDGKDVVTDYDAGYVATDTLRFGAGILANDITTRRVNSDLVFLHSNGTDQITFKGWFDGATSSAGVVTYNVIERVEFADGTFWTWADIVATGLNQVGTAAAETLTGWSGNDIIHGGDGNDTLSGGAGANQLYGDAGDDIITVAAASKGNTLVGGIGNDTLTGGNFADTYVFNLGDGKDVVTDYDAGYVATDTLRFGAGILANDITTRRVNSDLVFLHSNGTDQITFKGWFDGATSSAGVVTYNVIERVEFADGTFWTWADIVATGLNQVGTAAAETLTGWSGNDIIHGGDGNDTLSGGAGANQLYGDAGDDIITVAAASKGNTLVGGIGNDTLTGGNFADTYVFNLGDGKDVVTDYDAGYVATDTLRFGAGILANDITTRRVNSDLVFLHSNGTDQITFKGWFDGATSSAGVVTYNVIERVEFADGTFWTWADIVATGLNQVGTAAVETLIGWSGNDIIHGGDGSDTLSGGAGANQLYGDAGDDTITVATASKGNTLVGGTGNDTLTGGYYTDTYVFNLGDGKDVIADYDAGYVVTDTLRFGAGILASDIQVLKSGSDVVFKHRDGTDQVTVKGWLDGTAISAGVVTNNIIERVEFADGTFWTSADIAATGLSQIGTAAAETLTGWSGNDIIHGGDGNDTLSGGAGANQLYGDAGDDIITVAAASKGNTLVGGIGNDTLTGGNFADTYVFNLGDGKDVVTDYDAGYVATDTLRFGAGILANDITTRRVNSDLVFLHSNGTDQITFKGWFDGATSSAGVVTYNVIERVEFADGTFWTWADIVATGLNQVGTAAAETLIGWSGNDIIHGGDGSDTLSGGAGANQLYGDAGDDTITVATASKGNTLVGGTGNDTLTGGYYTDTYVFNLGDGKDVIADYDAGYVVTDTLRFGAGILASDIQVLKSGSDVVFKHRDGTDQVTVKGWLDGTAISAGVVTNNIIERVEFADGTFWTSADIAATGLSQIGTAAAETLTGWSGNDIIHGGDGNDTLSGGAGANQLYGDAGDDIITVAAASKGNTLVGGIGNDTLTGGNFADTYVFNLGDGKDVVTDYDAGYVATDTLRFGAGILANDITTRRVNSDLVFLHSNGTDQITFKGWFDGATSSAGVVTYNVIERVEFADGTFWTWADIVATGLNQVGTAAAETLTGWSGNDIIHGGDGNDTLSGGAGANQLYGDAGDDTIMVATASKGNTLVGGTGNDTLTGGNFADTYVLDRGDGKDVITDYDGGYVATDTLVFGADVSPQDLWFRRSGANLEISVIGATDNVTISNWYQSSAYHIESFKTADGKGLLDSQVQNLVDTMASFGVPAGAETSLTADQRTQLDTVLAANWK
ncbi:calcium-binding protein [Pseudomonas brassicacearum]|uniref:calcium-binding protein n=1 Tax=Pseudomonas brassicacearum TaxID=930166 RepID=UPI0011F15155|nr:calcium-binding protein [Pseudomonas brassicacearum]QEO78810.1 hypothetical protein ELZ14_15035 [Pseudomonas brassicacearum]